jgi:Fe2+ or Zn2+ uptake regulation protein
MNNVPFKILEFITNNHSPTSFENIADSLLKDGFNPNKTTIYRNLDKLQSEGLIKKVILSDSKQFWEIVDSKSRNSQKYEHFHLICGICDKIECREIPKVFSLSFDNFNVQKTEFNVFGTCQNCNI